MSSNRRIPTCDAIVEHQGQPVGPMLLPDVAAEAFIEEFNRVYRSIGLRINRMAEIERVTTEQASRSL